MKKLKLPPRNSDTIDRLLLSENKNDNNSYVDKHNRVAIKRSISKNMSNSFTKHTQNIDLDDQFDFKTKK